MSAGGYLWKRRRILSKIGLTQGQGRESFQLENMIGVDLGENDVSDDVQNLGASTIFVCPLLWGDFTVV